MLWMMRVWIWLPSAFLIERKRLRRGWFWQGRRPCLSGSPCARVPIWLCPRIRALILNIAWFAGEESNFAGAVAFRNVGSVAM